MYLKAFAIYKFIDWSPLSSSFKLDKHYNFVFITILDSSTINKNKLHKH